MMAYHIGDTVLSRDIFLLNKKGTQLGSCPLCFSWISMQKTAGID